MTHSQSMPCSVIDLLNLFERDSIFALGLGAIHSLFRVRGIP